MPVSPRIQVLLDQIPLPASAAKALRKLGAEIELSSFDRHDRPPSSTPIDARLIISADAAGLRSTRLPKLLSSCDANPCGTLILAVTETGVTDEPEPTLTERGVSIIYNPTEDELTAQLAVLAGMRGPIGAMRRELAALRARETIHIESLRKFDDERRLAGLVQREFQNGKAPQMRHGEWLTLYRPAEVVSGDLYDVVRLNADHLAISLLDATGHGLTSALLSAYGRRSVQAELADGTMPDELPASVLRNMNKELVAANLSECQFISALQAVFNERTNEITWSRGGGCYPILLRENRPPMQIRSAGPLVGIEADAQFETVRLQLAPGDTLLFFTDGLDALVRDEGDGNYSNEISETNWFAELMNDSIHDQFAAIAQRLDRAKLLGRQADDVTMIALHLHGSTARTSEPNMEPEESLAGMYL